MMDFSAPPRARPPENLLPMINVVFLLLVFFLIAAKLAPPEPFAVALPAAEAQAGLGGEFTLFLSSAGQAGFAEARGDAALAALAEARHEACTGLDCATQPPRLLLRADAAAPAAALTALMPLLSAAGFAEVTIVTLPK